MSIPFECRVFTFKEGALAALAHDLELVVRRCSIAVGADGSIDVRLDAGSLEVLHALDGGKPTQALSDADRRKIERTVRDEVLKAGRHPEIRFRAPPPEAEGEGYLVCGELSLVGRSRSLVLHSHRAGDRQLVEVVLHQPDFGIVPYRALLGALRIRPEVEVRVAVSWPLPRGA